MNEPSAPATERQLRRLEWASKRLGRQLPTSLTKAQASELITSWFEEEFPDLDLAKEWEEEKQRQDEERERREEQEEAKDVLFGEVDDWRGFYKCGPISRRWFDRVVQAVGMRADREPINHYMDRFFRELARQCSAPAPPKYSDHSPSRTMAQNTRTSHRSAIALLLLPVGLMGLGAASGFAVGGEAIPRSLASFSLGTSIAIGYCLPGWIAVSRKHHNSIAIALLNLLLGWTIIGWIAALIWSVTAVRN